jgi:neutral ceramidase
VIIYTTRILTNKFSTPKPRFDSVHLDRLIQMGFDTIKMREKLMQITNNSSVEIIFFLYDRTDLLLAAARVETTVAIGSTASLSHPKDNPCKIGIKKNGLFQRLGSFIVAPSGQTFRDNAKLILNSNNELSEVNAPTIPIVTPILTAAQRDSDVAPTKLDYCIGIGKARVSDPAANDPESKLPMQGWAQSSQNTNSVEQELYARAFIVVEPSTQKRIVLVVADIWSCSIAIKQEVCRRLLQGSERRRYNTENIWIAGTHTHSGPAGYLHHLLYNAMAFGFDQHVFENIVSGIVRAIDIAHESLQPGKIFYASGRVEGCGLNRSIDAFLNNPKSERDQLIVKDGELPEFTDKTMQLLKFITLGKQDEEISAGLLCWYAVHPTNRGQNCTTVNGDNKGWASQYLESELSQKLDSKIGFVAAFANSNCGDVSGNVAEFGTTMFRTKSGTIVLAKDPSPLVTDTIGQQFYPSVCEVTPAGPNTKCLDNSMIKMQYYGHLQAVEALRLFGIASEELSGSLNATHKFVDFPKRSGLSGSIGLSMAAGSTEDGDAGTHLAEGIIETDINSLGKTNAGLLPNLAVNASTLLNTVDGVIVSLSGPNPPRNFLQSIIDAKNASNSERQMHFPKPVLLITGAVRPDPMTPNILPVQIISIGSFAVLGIPGEMTTMAGHRLRSSTEKNLSDGGIKHVAIGTYANGYSQYITTKEEYQIQAYEGASTLFGPETLNIYEAVFGEIAAAHLAGTPAMNDSACPDLSATVLTKRRMTFRNESAQDVRFRIFQVEDEYYSLELFPGANFIVKAASERAITLPLWLFFITHVQVVIGNQTINARNKPTSILFPSTRDLILVSSNGVVT